MADRPLEPASDETLDRLAGALWVFQLRGGHRYATDDVLTAWEAVNARPDAARMLDMGCGIGSVGLMALLRLPADARLTSLEIQDRSVALLHKTVAHNGLGTRVDVRQGDLRDGSSLPPDARFDLIAANPPYWNPSREMPSPHPQRAAARLELNGDVFDYCAAAARWLADDGRFCLCFPAGDARCEEAVAAAGLTLRSRREVAHRVGGDPYLALLVCGRGGDRRDPPPLFLRDADGQPTPEFLALSGAI